MGRYAILLILFISCGKNLETVNQRGKEVVLNIDPAQAEDYSYEFSTLKCTTGIQSFDTFVAACNGLKDDALNDNCAQAKRQQLFESENCPGSFDA